MTVFELRETLDALGVKTTTRTKKAELMRLLEEAEAKAQDELCGVDSKKTLETASVLYTSVVLCLTVSLGIAMILLAKAFM